MKTTTIVPLIFGLFCAGFGLPAPTTFDRSDQEDDCTVSNLDGEQRCMCGPGRKISQVSAVYDSGRKDRQYLFKCTDIPGNVGGFSGDSWSFFESDYTAFDDYWAVSTQWLNNKGDWVDSEGDAITQRPSFTNWFLIGVRSWHNNHYEDREFKFFYVKTTKYVLANCKSTSMSSYGSTLTVPSQLESLNWGDEKVFTNIKSWHGYNGNDRKFVFEYCDLTSKCRQLKSMTYHEDEMTTNENGDTSVNSKIIDNLHMSYPIVSTIELTESNTESISESYSFGGSETSEIGASLEISQSVSYGTPAISGETSVTASISSLFTWESNWDRSSSQDYGQEHSTTLSWEITCPSRCYCERKIEVKKLKYNIPYTMVAETPETGETCSENGTVIIDLASEAILTGGDYTAASGHRELCEQDSDDLNINLTKLNRFLDSV